MVSVSVPVVLANSCPLFHQSSSIYSTCFTFFNWFLSLEHHSLLRDSAPKEWKPPKKKGKGLYLSSMRKVKTTKILERITSIKEHQLPRREGHLVKEDRHSVLVRHKTALLIWLAPNLTIVAIKFVNFMPRLQSFFSLVQGNASASSVAGFMNYQSLMKLREAAAGVWQGTMSDDARARMILTESSRRNQIIVSLEEGKFMPS